MGRGVVARLEQHVLARNDREVAPGGVDPIADERLEDDGSERERRHDEAEHRGYRLDHGAQTVLARLGGLRLEPDEHQAGLAPPEPVAVAGAGIGEPVEEPEQRGEDDDAREEAEHELERGVAGDRVPKPVAASRVLCEDVGLHTGAG